MRRTTPNPTPPALSIERWPGPGPPWFCACVQPQGGLAEVRSHVRGRGSRDPYGPAADPPDVAVSEGYGRCGSLSEGPGRSACTQVMRWVFSSLRGACWAWPGRRARCLAACRAQPAPTPAGAGAVMPALAGARGAGTHATRALWRASASQGAACLSASFCARLQPHNGCKPAFCSRHAGCLLVLQVGCALALVVGTGLSVGSGQGSCFCGSCSGVLHDAPLAWPSCSSWAGRPTACRAAACDCRAGTGVLRRIVL